jgi:hypothetical protein
MNKDEKLSGVWWFWPNSAQELWNMLLVCFTALLAFCAYHQIRTDEAFLVLGVPQITLPNNLKLVITNVGKEPAVEGKLTAYTGFMACQGYILEEPVGIITTDIPPVSPNQSLPPLWTSVPPERVRQMKDQKCGAAVIAAKLSWSGWFFTNSSSFCWNTFVAFSGEVEWTICNDAQRDIIEDWRRRYEKTHRRIPPVL